MLYFTPTEEGYLKYYTKVGFYGPNEEEDIDNSIFSYLIDSPPTTLDELWNQEIRDRDSSYFKYKPVWTKDQLRVRLRRLYEAGYIEATESD